MENKDDFKYILQDTTHVYFGKELTYNEIMEKDDAPFKFKAIISNYFLKDVDVNTKLSDHILNADESTFSYKIFNQLKVEIKYFYKEETNGLFGKKKTKWQHKTCKAGDLKTIKEKFDSKEALVEEISLSKLALMMISI